MIKRTVFIIILFVIILNLPVSCEDGINGLIDRELGGIKLDSFDIVEFKNDIMKNGELPDAKDILDKLSKILLKETADNLKILLLLIVPILLMSVLSNMAIREDGVINAASIAAYLAISSIIVYVFSDVTGLARKTAEEINIMSECMLPVLYSVMLTMGKVTSYTVMHPTVIFLSQLLMLIINKVMFPLIMLSFALNITDNITGKEKFKRISGLINKFTKWALIFLITLFTAILSAQNILTHSFDSVAMKGTKFVVANFVPIVGGAISDGAETIGSSLLLIKNATGIAGIAAVLVVALTPIIKIYLVSFMFFILSAVSQLSGGEKIAGVLDSTGSTVSMLGAIIVSISFLFVISVAIMLGG